MNLEPRSPITQAELQQSTLVFTVLACALFIPLTLLNPSDLETRLNLVLLVTAGFFWGILSLLAFRYFWEIYYQYIYPDWVRRLWGINFIFYGFIAWGMWLISRKTEFSAVGVFLFLGGLEGVLEHIIGIYVLDVINKVPWLHGLKAFPILVFSFVEYVVYWSIVLWISLAFQALI